MTKVQVSDEAGFESNLVSDVFLTSLDTVALEVVLNEDGMEIAAYGDLNLPSILVSKDKGPFKKITFLDFKDMKVWSAEISGRTLRLCLAKFERNPTASATQSTNAKLPAEESRWRPAARTWVDPPSGWRFGFPKVWDKEKHEDFQSWLISEGYPESEIKRMGDYFHCRFWNADE